MRLGLALVLALVACGPRPAAPVQPEPAVAASRAPAPELVANAELEAKIDPIVAALLDEAPAASLSVAIARGGELVFARGYGQANREQSRAANARTIYRIGSVTKQFTAALVMQLVAEGKLGLDDPVTRHLPDFPINDDRITVRRLLNHTSGLYNYTDEEFAKTSDQARTVADVIAYFGKHPLEFEPGAKWEYSNSNYLTLGAILEALTGSSYAELVAQRIARPLELDSLAYCPHEPTQPDEAAGYKVDDGALAPSDPVHMVAPHAAGALCATAADLVAWTVALHGERVVSPEALRQMLTPAPLVGGASFPYGFGLALGKLEGHPSVSHDGGINGFMSSLAYYPTDDVAIAVLINSESGAAQRGLARISRVVLDIPETETKDLPLTAEQAAPYLGTYTFDAAPGVVFAISFEDGKLVASAMGTPVPLLNQGDGVFLAPKVEARLTFGPDTLTINQGGLEIVGRRTPAP